MWLIKKIGYGEMNWERGTIETIFFGSICCFLYDLKVVCEKIWLIFYVANKILSH